MMVFRFLARLFLARQAAPWIENLTDRLADSKPIRRSARFMAYIILRGSEKLNSEEFKSFLQKFSSKIKDKIDGKN